jgi:hypothetical protein
MNFKICDGKTLCIDLRKSTQKEITLIINIVISTCELLEKAGRTPLIKLTEESEPESSNKQVC